MFVFLDDSGDPGFKMPKGSSPCFVIALVIFDDHLEAETCAVEIKTLRRELPLSDQFEFKFSTCSDVFRNAFVTRVVSYTFRVRAIVMRKDAIEYRTMIHKRIEDVWNFGEGEGVNIVRPSSYPEDPRARAPYGDSSDAGSL